ncbi:MAG: TonB-dependent receptor [bacterium]
MGKRKMLFAAVYVLFAGGTDKGYCFSPSYLGDIGEVVVYGKREDIASLVCELSASDIEKSGVRNVSEALELVAGSDVQTVDKGESRVSLRGFEQRNLKVLIDGIPAYEGYFGTVDLSAIPAESIEKIVVTKGASSVLYGANTMGGVVNIITKKDAGGASVSSSFGGYHADNFTLNHGGVAGKLNYYLGVGRRSSDGQRLSGDFDANNQWTGESSEYCEDGGIRELSDYEKRSLVANFGFKPDSRTRINLSASYFNQERSCPVSMFRYWRFSGWDQWQINLAVEKKLSPAATIKTRVFYVDHSDKLVDDAVRTIAAGGKSWFDKSRYDDFSAGGEINSFINIGGSNLLRTGASYQKDQNRQAEYNTKNWSGAVVVPGWGDEETYEVATFCIGAEDSIILGERVSFVLGAGIDCFRPVKSAEYKKPDSIRTFNPQAGINFNTGGNTRLFASAGKKTRFPTMKELYSLHAGGNPDIKEQKTIATEIGIEKKFSGGADFSVSIFRNQVDDLIESVNKTYVNIEETEMRGIEAEIKADVSNGLNIAGNYTCLYAKEKRDENGSKVDIKLSQRPEHKINLMPRYDSPSGFSVSLPFSFTGRQKVDDRYAASYFLLNAKISYKLRTLRRISPEIFASVSNILDADYEEGSGPMPGRNFLAGLKLAF